MLLEHTDSNTGEIVEKETSSLVFEDLNNGEQFQIFESGGLRNTLEQSDVREGETVKIIHLGKVPLKKKPGQTVNQYDVFTAG